MAADKSSLEKQLEDYRFALSKVSHEVRNPVTLINSYLQLLEKDHPELKQNELWSDITEEMLNEDIVRLNIEMLDFNADILVNGIPAGHQENTFCAFSADIKRFLQLITACLSYPYGITMMIYLFITINILWLFVWYFFVKREIPLTLSCVLKDIAPYFLLAATLTASAYYITLGIRNLYLSLLIKIVLVVSLYALILWKLQSVIFRECIEFIRKKI